jgi:hypothetical protein
VTEVENLYSPSRYWLELQPTEPAVKFRGSTFLAGDLLLMETDRSQFPAPDKLNDRWAVIRTPAPNRFQPCLARLSYSPAGGAGDPAVLEAETFEHHPTFGTRVVLELVPGGEPRVSVHEVRYEQPPATAKLEKGEAPKRHGLSLLPRGVELTDVIALCVLVVRRFG